MTRSAHRSTILIEVDGHTLATAEVHRTDVAGVVHTDLHVESGHLPAGTRARLVDAVLAETGLVGLGGGADGGRLHPPAGGRDEDGDANGNESHAASAAVAAASINYRNKDEDDRDDAL